MYYDRQLKQQLQKTLPHFPVVAVTGSRQSGKTTFLQHNFKDYKYFNLEDTLLRERIAADPNQFLAQNPSKIILDEVQNVPDLLSHIQVHVDKNQEMGSIILSGSQNLLLSEHISQSLAGRAAYLHMHPLTHTEMQANKLLNKSHLDAILDGCYPAKFARQTDRSLFYSQYIATYLERDVRMVQEVAKISQFRRFVQLVAGRVGQVLNISSLANDTGVSPNTAEKWLSILEASFLIYRLQPYFSNTNKRLIKSPKVYFYDTGLLTSLLNIKSADELAVHHSVGSIFENMVISEILKELNNSGSQARLYFYRTARGEEVDLIIDNGATKQAIEIKSSSGYNSNFHKSLKPWRDQAQTYIVNAGDENYEVRGDKLVGWRDVAAAFGKD